MIMSPEEFKNKILNNEKLPSGITVDGNLSLWYYRSYTSLKTLPKELVVKGNLDLNYCTFLTHLPKGLVVNRNLNLFYCKSLKTLPEGLVVNRNLDLRGCTSLKNLSEDMKINNKIYADKELIDQTPKETLLMYISNFQGDPNFINRITQPDSTKSV